MPYYDYKCKVCGTVVTVKHDYNEIVSNCINCGSEVRKLLSVPHVVYKGSGFYTTDNGETQSHDTSTKTSQ